MQYDAAGNVLQRQDAVAGLTENMAYDNLNRLTNSYGASVADNGVSYDAFGNILNKADVGNYIYGQTCNGVKPGPHAVTQTTGGAYSASYCYDKNGNLTSKTQTNGFNQQVIYTAFNKPYQILQSDSSGTQLEYGPSRELIRQTDSKSGSITTTIYLPGYERSQKGSAITEKFYIGDYALFAKSGTSSSIRYLLQDNQGSVTTVLDQDGAPTENLAFDVWGKRRNSNWSPATTSLASATTNRGYTGHKMLDNVGLVHMNGRVYDPVIARFVSADPIIQAPGDLQSYNRYAYVRNNPGSLVDPSGYSWLSKTWKKAWHSQNFRLAVAIGLSIWTGGLAYGAMAPAGACYTTSAIVGASITAGAVGGATMGASLTAMNGGNFREIISAGAKGGAQGAMSGALFGGVSGFYGDQWSLGRVAATGTTGGVSSVAAGGSFQDGFKLSAILAVSQMGWQYTKEATDRYKLRSCELDLSTCKNNKWGELLTDGGRGEIPGSNTGKENFITKGGMALEASGDHLYDENSLVGRFINRVSKTHDWFNSDASRNFGFKGYDPATGMWLAGGTAHNTAFQIYSFSGMLPAAIFTTAAISQPYTNLILQSREL